MSCPLPTLTHLDILSARIIHLCFHKLLPPKAIHNLALSTTQICSNIPLTDHSLGLLTPLLLSSCFLPPCKSVNQSLVSRSVSFSSNANLSLHLQTSQYLALSCTTLQRSTLDYCAHSLLLCPEKYHAKPLEELNKLMPQ